MTMQVAGLIGRLPWAWCLAGQAGTSQPADRGLFIPHPGHVAGLHARSGLSQGSRLPPRTSQSPKGRGLPAPSENRHSGPRSQGHCVTRTA